MHTGISNVARWTTAAGLLAATAGLVLLFMNAAAEVSTGQSQSLMDGYWMGRLPWTAIGIDLAVIGSTIAIVAGTIATWLAGGIIRRIASAVVLAMAAFWWFVALLDTAGWRLLRRLRAVAPGSDDGRLLAARRRDPAAPAPRRRHRRSRVHLAPRSRTSRRFGRIGGPIRARRHADP